MRQDHCGLDVAAGAKHGDAIVSPEGRLARLRRVAGILISTQ